MISIVDPVAGFWYSLDPESKIAWQDAIGGANAIMGKLDAMEERKTEVEKVATELRAGEEKIEDSLADEAADGGGRGGARGDGGGPRGGGAAAGGGEGACGPWWRRRARRPDGRRRHDRAARAQDDRRGRGRGTQDDHRDPGRSGRQRAADHHHLGRVALARAQPARPDEALRPAHRRIELQACRTSSAPSPIGRSSWCRPTTPSGRPASAGWSRNPSRQALSTSHRALSAKPIRSIAW